MDQIKQQIPVSLKMTTQVWRGSRQKGSSLLVLLAIADYADDNGKAWPGIETLARMTRLTPRNVQLIVRKLQAEGELLVKIGAGQSGVNIYQITDKIGGEIFSPGVKTSDTEFHRGGEAGFTRGGEIAISPDPPVQPPINHQELNSKPRAEICLKPFLTEARVLIHFLNETVGRKFGETDTNLKFVRSRLEDCQGDLEGCKKMILRMKDKWMGTKWEEFLRPSTLFNSEKFDAYYANRDMPINNDEVKKKGVRAWDIKVEDCT